MIQFHMTCICLISTLGITLGRDSFSFISNIEVDTAKCRSSCLQSHNVTQPNTNQECEPIRIDSDGTFDNNAECSECWDTCQQLSNGTSQTWSDVCEKQHKVECTSGCQMACRILKNKSKYSNRHLTKSLGSVRTKKLQNDDRDENRVQQQYHRRPQRIRDRQNRQRRRQRTRHKDIQLDIPTVLENCMGLSWTDPTKNINFATSPRKRNRGGAHPRRQDHLHALIYILFARDQLNKWFEITQTTHFSYMFQFPISTLDNLNEIRLLAVSDYGIIDQVSLNVSSLNCNAEKSPITQPLISEDTSSANHRYRRTFRNRELDDLIEYIRTPHSDRYFLPLVIGCLILALACIVILLLLIIRSMFKNRSTAVNTMNNKMIGSPVEEGQNMSFEDKISVKDYSIFTIYEPDLIQNHSSGEEEDRFYMRQTQL